MPLPMTVRRDLELLVLVLPILVAAAHAQSAELPRSTVGVPVAVEQLVLPGTELEPVPVTDETLVVIRIDRVYPHGTALRYDLVYYGVEPGEYDLRQFLRRKDGSGTDDLPALPVTVASLLPPGQIEPHALTFAALPRVGGYWLLMALAAIVWVAGMVWVLWPRRRAVAATAAVVVPPMSLADRLRPLVTEAMAGRLAPERLAELERALVSYWRRRRSLEDLAPAVAIAQLRADPQASPLITQLEAWLHRPAGERQVDVNALLEPYRDIAPEDLDAAAALVGGVAVR